MSSSSYSSSSSRRQKPPTVFSVLALWLLLLTITTTSPTHGYRQSTCTYNEAHTAANCSNKNLDYVPWRLHKNINALDLSSNNFSILKNKSFIDYVYITELCLRNNSMDQIKANAFLKLNYLKILDLSNNKLTQIPTDSTKIVSHSLERLILAGNKLFYIPKQAFSHLHKLQLLDLSGNSIYNLDNGAFVGLSSLTVFKIQNNAIKHLPSDSFDDFPEESMTQVQLYDNRWVCDCKMRWLWTWLNVTSPSVWESPGYPIRCDGPTLVGDQSLDSLPLDKLACRVRMKTSGYTRELDPGGNTTLGCKYTAIPKAEAIWMKNSDAIDYAAARSSSGSSSSRKYSVSFEEARDSRGNVMYVSELRINDFKRDDIARYKCLIQNIRGEEDTEYKLTLKGVDFDSVVFNTPVSHKAGDSAGVDKRSIIIAVAVVGGIILIIVIGVLIFCSVNRVQRKKQAKRDKIVEHVKEHFIKNSDVTGNGGGDPSATMDKTKSAFGRIPDDGTGNGISPAIGIGLGDNHHHHQQQHHTGTLPYDDNRSNHTNDSTYKPPLDSEESEPMLIMSSSAPTDPHHHHHHHPLNNSNNNNNNNGNTYVSFGSEFTDPGEFPAHVPSVYSNPHHHHQQHHHQTPILGGGGNNHYDMPDGGGGPAPRYPPPGSQDGSATPLLDRFTPVFLDDSDEPVEDYASYPVYDSLTNSLQHPRLAAHTPPVVTHHNGGGGSNNMVYNDGGRIYGTLPANSTHNNPHYQQITHPRGGGGNSNQQQHNRSLGSQSPFQFQYPAPVGGGGSQSGYGSGSMPRTPGSVRSVAAVPPWNINPNNPNNNNTTSYSGGGPGSTGNASPPIIENHYHPPPLVHRPHPEYRDYRDMRYPITTTTPNNSITNPGGIVDLPLPPPPPPISNMAATPPANRDVAHTRNNLGYSPVPSPPSGGPSSSFSSGPKKPPRVYIPGSNGSSSSSSRDCIEMSMAPISSSSSPPHSHSHSQPQPHDSTSSDYITSSEAQQYSKNYGITPGTPV